MGYQGNYEWDGEAFIERLSGGAPEQPMEATRWDDELTREEWRDVFLAALKEDVADDVHLKDCACRACDCFRASIAAFGDAINTGFYVNSYTTKQCPSMEGVLENLRQLIDENGLDPTDLPYGEVGFSQTILGVTFHGKAWVYNGFFQGMYSMR